MAATNHVVQMELVQNNHSEPPMDNPMPASTDLHSNMVYANSLRAQERRNCDLHPEWFASDSEEHQAEGCNSPSVHTDPQSGVDVVSLAFDQTDWLIGVIRLTEDGLFECRHRWQPQDCATKGFPRRSDAARYLLITGYWARPIDELRERAAPASRDAVRRAA
jgi:hypothetical protein